MITGLIISLFLNLIAIIIIYKFARRAALPINQRAMFRIAIAGMRFFPFYLLNLVPIGQVDINPNWSFWKRSSGVILNKLIEIATSVPEYMINGILICSGLIILIPILVISIRVIRSPYPKSDEPDGASQERLTAYAECAIYFSQQYVTSLMKLKYPDCTEETALRARAMFSKAIQTRVKSERPFSKESVEEIIVGVLNRMSNRIRK